MKGGRERKKKSEEEGWSETKKREKKKEKIGINENIVSVIMKRMKNCLSIYPARYNGSN